MYVVIWSYADDFRGSGSNIHPKLKISRPAYHSPHSPGRIHPPPCCTWWLISHRRRYFRIRAGMLVLFIIVSCKPRSEYAYKVSKWYEVMKICFHMSSFFYSVENFYNQFSVVCFVVHLDSAWSVLVWYISKQSSHDWSIISCRKDSELIMVMLPD